MAKKTGRRRPRLPAPKTVPISSLTPHPKNYCQHPEDQIEHIKESILEHGLYRNIVVANDLTILAGHGVVEAAKLLGIKQVPIIKVKVGPNDPRALKLLAGDNEISHLREIDDRMLTSILKEIKEHDEEGLLGTGFDDAMLANLLFVTKPASEVQDFDEAAHWVGMPEYNKETRPLQMNVSFRNMKDRAEFVKLLGLDVTDATKAVWFPQQERRDIVSVKFLGEGYEKESPTGLSATLAGEPPDIPGWKETKKK